MKYCPQCRLELQHRPVDGIERMACPASSCGYVRWDNPTPVVIGLVEHGEHYVLARNASWPAGTFSLISGFVENGESPEEAMLRETREELGVSTGRVEFIGHYVLPELNQLLIAFSVQASGTIFPSEEIAELRLLSRSELERYDFGRLALAAKIVAQRLGLGGRTE